MALQVTLTLAWDPRQQYDALLNHLKIPAVKYLLTKKPLEPQDRRGESTVMSHGRIKTLTGVVELNVVVRLNPVEISIEVSDGKNMKIYTGKSGKEVANGISIVLMRLRVKLAEELKRRESFYEAMNKLDVGIPVAKDNLDQLRSLINVYQIH